MVSFKITQTFYDEIVAAAEREGHNSVSDFVKYAIRYYMMECWRQRGGSQPEAGEKAVVSQTTSGRT